ncbi:hypothetical protein N7494_000394 [Penicillium frequentans]|uniref:Zn(2)-C6 fungal-type domain-containing protein n=1 Tax=Penicillium frequentans TaxID=3151616 RepID=A0AAD6D5Q9_9EURO|nr:hypothetical protein N7494_000394 [Penicillium glabrum]
MHSQAFFELQFGYSDTDDPESATPPPSWKQFRFAPAHSEVKVAETQKCGRLCIAEPEHGATSMEASDGSPSTVKDKINRTRQKVTHACNGCRRRRVKCDGVAPCSNCAKHDITCNFDHASRGRRGPRPRSNVIHLTGARRTLKSLQLVNEIELEKNFSALEDLNASLDISLGDDIGHPELIDDLAQDSLLPSYQQGPPLETWRQFVAEATSRQDLTKKYSAPGITGIDAICHFVELFWTHANFLYGTLLSKDRFLEQECGGKPSLALYMSMCALGSLFSSHDIAQDDITTNTSNTYESIARTELDGDNHWSSLVSSQCYCLLGFYCAGQNKGAQAWNDFGNRQAIATARSRLQIFKAMVPHLSSSDSVEMERIDRMISFAEGVTSLGNLSLQKQIFTIDVFNNIWPEEPSSLSLFRLVEILAQTQQACNMLLPSQEGLPWEPDTAWRSMEKYLEKYPMRHSDKFCPNLETLDKLIQDGAIERIISVMLDVLFKVQEPDSYILHDVGSENKFIIRPYFDRFHNIEEATFMCLTPPASDEESLIDPSNQYPSRASCNNQTHLGDAGDPVAPGTQPENNHAMPNYTIYVDDLYYPADDFDPALDASHEGFLFLGSEIGDHGEAPLELPGVSSRSPLFPT